MNPMSGITHGCTWVPRDTVRADVRVPVQMARGFALGRGASEPRGSRWRAVNSLRLEKRLNYSWGERECKSPHLCPPAAPRCGSVGGEPGREPCDYLGGIPTPPGQERGRGDKPARFRHGTPSDL